MMESVTDIACNDTGVLGDQTISCNGAAVLASSVGINNITAMNFQQQENHNPNVMEVITVTGVTNERNCFNEIPSDYEDTGNEILGNDLENVTATHEVPLPVKTLSPTIFENAVKVVKNLFSPAKAHGLFSRGVCQQQPDTNQIERGDINIFNENTLPKSEQASVCERKASLTLCNLENNLCFNEEDAAGLSTKNFSNSADTHNNTNDSYTSTVSRMEESFQSTVTHFDDCTQNEVENSNNIVDNIENSSIFDSSMNDTIGANEHSLNNTLKKNISISFIENGELNVTFERDDIEPFIPKIENNEICGIDESSIEVTSVSCAPTEESKESKVGEGSSSGLAKEAFELITKSVASREIENSILFQEENLAKIASSSTPNKQSLEDTTCNNTLLVNFFPEKLDYLDQKEENNDSGSSQCAFQSLDVRNGENLSPFSSIIHSSETACPDFSERKDNVSPETINNSSPCAGLEKNFSTSTIIISNNEIDNINSSNIDDTHVLKTELPLIENEPEIHNDLIGAENFTIEEKGSHEEVWSDDKKENQDLSNSQLIWENVNHEVGENTNILPVLNEPESVICPSDSKSLNEQNLETYKTSQHISEKSVADVFDQDLETLKLMENNIFSENELGMKSEESPADETGIPLASQKSYTVLHNINPNLTRPIVTDNTCDVQADKLSDIILGSRTFSDLDVLYTKNINFDEINIPNIENVANLSDYFPVSSNGMPTNTPDIDPDIKHIKTCQPEIPGRTLIDTADKLEFDKSTSLSSVESQADCVEPEIENSKYRKQNTSSTSLNLSVHEIPEASDNIMEKIGKSDSAIVKLSQSSLVTSGNSSVGDILLFEGKKDDKTNKKWHSERELSPLMKLIPNEEAAKDSFASSMASSFICGDGTSLLPNNFVVPVENSNVNDFYNIKDICGLAEDNAMNSKVDSKNIESEVVNSVEGRIETNDLQNDLDNIISDFERLKMNDNATEKAKKCNSGGDISFCTAGKLDELVALDDEVGPCENEKNTFKNLNSVTELTQFIKEQFTATDIEKICSVVDDMPELNLSKNIAIASQQFDRSFHGKILNENENNSAKVNSFVIKDDNDLDFLDSIKGKPSGRDYSRESLYIKFDPLMQSKHSTTLLDISEGDKENVVGSPITRNGTIADPPISVTPLKQNINVNCISPLIPTTQNKDSKLSTEKLNKLMELQNEISRLREYYTQREEINKEKLINYENEITKLTGKACVLEDKLKESEEMERSLVKKLNAQNESMSRIKSIVEEYMAYISKLTDEIQKLRKDNQKKISVLKEERDYYMNHLQSTEQAFSDVFNKYEKCKKAVEVYKKNEETIKLNIENMNDRIEQYSEKIRIVQETAAKEINRLQEKMNELKLNHFQEISKFKAQLRITELKVQTVQEALEQKIKENQELAGICDELIEGKDGDR